MRRLQPHKWGREWDHLPLGIGVQWSKNLVPEPRIEKRDRIEPTAASTLLQRGYKRQEFAKVVHDHILSRAAW
eukprot:8399781-Pyramimonas_sp.AAC.1